MASPSHASSRRHHRERPRTGGSTTCPITYCVFCLDLIRLELTDEPFSSETEYVCPHCRAANHVHVPGRLVGVSLVH